MTERPTLTVQTPFGDMRAVLLGDGQINLQDRSTPAWNEHTKTYISHDPISINGVKYRANFTAKKAPTGEWVQTYGSIDKEGSVKAYDYSPAALRKFTQIMPTVCADLEKAHPELFHTAQIAKLTDEFDAAVRKVDKLAEELEEAREDARRLREELTRAQADAGQLDGEQMERRYLTRAEIKKLAEHASTEEFARYLTEYDHQWGNGACLEVVLSVAQAREIDSLCELYQIAR